LPDLKIGDGLKPKPPDPNVALVQQKLGITMDGRFGKETQTAVIQFQKKTGLAPDQPIETLRARGFGAVKQATWTKLFAVRAS
jgi:peptidoglycan hydrolase-like protein with peptidoglycan-binding domain